MQDIDHQDIDHAEAETLLGAYAAGALSDVDWLMVRTHLSGCTTCRADLGRPDLWNRAAPQWISPQAPAPWRTVHARRTRSRPGWPVVIGLALVVALVAFGVGYAVGTGA